MHRNFSQQSTGLRTHVMPVCCPNSLSSAAKALLHLPGFRYASINLLHGAVRRQISPLESLAALLFLFLSVPYPKERSRTNGQASSRYRPNRTDAPRSAIVPCRWRW